MAEARLVVALLRSVNVGGHNKLPMADLRKALAAAGCSDVKTYIQSGNIVFCPPEGQAPKAVVQRVLADDFGLDVPVVIRSRAEFLAVAASHPLREQAGDDKQLAVGFLAEQPSAAAAAGLDPDRSPPDRFEVRGQEIFLLYPNGQARSKLTNAWFDRQLGVVSTMRNWRTVGKLAALL